ARPPGSGGCAPPRGPPPPSPGSATLREGVAVDDPLAGEPGDPDRGPHLAGPHEGRERSEGLRPFQTEQPRQLPGRRPPGAPEVPREEKPSRRGASESPARPHGVGEPGVDEIPAIGKGWFVALLRLDHE